LKRSAPTAHPQLKALSYLTLNPNLVHNPYPHFHFSHFSSLIILGTPPQKEASSPRFINSHSEFIYVFMGVPHILLFSCNTENVSE
jgi:hypothetical protein